MSIIKTRAVVIKSQDYKENDKLLWLFSEKLGKISLIAKCARKTKSKLMSVTLPFCYGEFVLFKGKSLYILNEGKIIESFQDILDDFDSLIYGSYLTELTDICCEEESYPSLFRDLVVSLYLIKNKAIDLEVLARAFELKVLKNTGYGLNLEHCALCGEKIKKSNYLSLQYYGMICDSCEKKYGTYISTVAYNVLKFLNNVEIEKTSRIKINCDVKKEIYKILKSIIDNNYSKRPKSLSMLENFYNIDKNLEK